MADAAVTTIVTELPESRVRVQAEVSPEEIERRVARAAQQLGRNLRIPGFRTGKVPPPVVIQRVGREAVLDEAVRDAIGHWYTAAIDDAKIVPVGEPDLDLAELPAEGEPLRFSIEIGVRPRARLGDYKDVEVGRDEPAVDDDEVRTELEALRERTARLETAEGPAGRGDFIVMDYVGTLEGTPFPGGEGRDQLIELGSGRLIPGFEEQLEGAVAGEDRRLTITFPADYGAKDLAGREAEFAVTVKEVKRKVLPELDEEFAVEQGFDSIDELEQDIRERLLEGQRQRLEREFRETALDAVVEGATVEVPDALVEARARELWDQMAHSLAHQGIDRSTYLKIAGKTEAEVVAEAKPDAERQLKREAVLAAVAEAEGIDPDDKALMEALEPAAQRERTTPKKLLERLKSAGRLDGLRQDLATSKALDVIVENAKPVPVEHARARRKLWTPEKEGERAAARGKLWTPSS